MKNDEVPQQAAKAFLGHSKALYATDSDGKLSIVPSAGWEAEEVVLDQAIAEYDEAAAQAHAQAKSGQGSTLAYHMAKRRMDVLLLAQSSGFFQWQVRRHLRPEIFSSLSPSKLQRYAEALGLSVEALRSLPEAP
jgi:hypothetical protein